jgi:hypothetical protein
MAAAKCARAGSSLAETQAAVADNVPDGAPTPP